MSAAFDMFTKKSGVYFDGSKRERNQANSQFIMKVREEDRRDKILEDVFMRSTKENPYTKHTEANIALCKAIAEENTSKQIAERRKMVPRRTNEDLRQLEYKLRAAYVSKAVAAQNYEANQLKIEEKAKMLHENQILQAARLMNCDYLKRQTTENREKKEALKRDLQEQMALTAAKRQEEKLTIMEDRKLMDEAVRQYEEERLKAERNLREQKLRLKKEMEDYQAFQTKWRNDHSRVDEKEQEKYEKLVAQSEENRRKFLQEKKELKIQRALKSEEMGRVNNEAAELKRKSFDLLTDLLIDERQANDDMKCARENERKSLERIQFRNDLLDQHKLREKQKINEKKEQEKLHSEMTRILEMKDAIQREKDENKRKETEAHRAALIHALNEKKRLKVKEMKRLLTEESNIEADLKRREREIQKARGDMIREHAPALRGFLMPDIVREGHNMKAKT